MSILGPKHRALQDLRRLSGRRSARRDEGRFVIDGPMLCLEALDAGLSLDVYVDEAVERTVLDALSARGVEPQHVVSGALAKAVSTVTSQGVAAIATMPTSPALNPAPGADDGLLLVLVEVRDPGNAGTLIRVAEAAGASALALAGDAVDVWNPKCVRASAGSLFRVPIIDLGSDDVVVTLRSAGYVVAACAGDSRGVGPEDLDLTGSVAVLVGNEAHGLAASIVDTADAIVSIPMNGQVESLNVAMAGCVVAFEAARQRRASVSGGSADQSGTHRSSGSRHDADSAR